MLADEKDAEIEATISPKDTNVDPILRAAPNVVNEQEGSQNDEEFDEQDTDQFDESAHQKYRKIRAGKAVLNKMLFISHILSCYLVTRYRYNDKRAVRPNETVSLKISDFIFNGTTNAVIILLSLIHI